jgi:hypothetical protein
VGTSLTKLALCLSATLAVCALVAPVAPAPVNRPVPLGERWNGHSWRVQGNPVFDGELEGVSCTSARSCTAVGINRDSGDDLALAEHWNGARWRIQRTPRPSGAQSSELTGVSCASSRACSAVGNYVDSAGNQFALAERWDGSRWRRQSTPRITGAQGAVLSGVSCVSRRACAAVGSYTDAAGTQLPLAERWDGAAWHTEPASAPHAAHGAELVGLSCTSARACVAVGDFTTAAGRERPLIERWNGSTWSVVSGQLPRGTREAHLSGVSCSSSRACTATGGYSKTGPQVVLVERWNGTRWTLQRTPPSSAAELDGVSCPSRRFCTAVGRSSRGTLAERWGGIRWRSEHTPPPPVGVFSEPQLNAVSCRSSTFCSTVGLYLTLP